MDLDSIGFDRWRRDFFRWKGENHYCFCRSHSFSCDQSYPTHLKWLKSFIRGSICPFLPFCQANDKTKPSNELLSDTFDSLYPELTLICHLESSPRQCHPRLCHFLSGAASSHIFHSKLFLWHVLIHCTCICILSIWCPWNNTLHFAWFYESIYLNSEGDRLWIRNYWFHFFLGCHPGWSSYSYWH